MNIIRSPRWGLNSEPLRLQSDIFCSTMVSRNEQFKLDLEDLVLYGRDDEDYITYINHNSKLGN